MSDERLRLIAEFRNNASAGVSRLKRDLGEIRETPGMNAAQKWMKGFELNAKAMQQAGTGAGSVMGSLGLGGLAAAGGIAAAVKSFRDLAEQTSSLQAVSRETGVAVTQLKQFQNAAKELHVDPEAMSQGVVHLTGQLALARRGYGELYGMLNQVEPEFMRKIMNEDPTSAMKDVLDRLARIPDDYVRSGRSLADGIAAQKQWTQELLGDQGLNRLVEAGPKALHEALADAAKNTPVVTGQMIAAAEALHKSVVALDTSMENFQTEAGPFIFKQLTQATNDFREAFKEVEGVVEWVEKHAAHPFKDAANAALDATDAQAAQNSSTEDRATRAGGPRDKMILDLPGVASRLIHGVVGDKALGRGDFAPAADDGEKAARLTRMQAEIDALDAKLKADKNPIGFPVREADNIARLRELRDAIATMRGDTTVTAPHQGIDNPLLHRSAYREDDDGTPARGSVGGMDGGLVLLFREVIASGTKAGFLGAFHELQGEKPIEGGGGGLLNASYGGEGVGGSGNGGGSFGSGAGGRRAPSLRYGRQHEGAPFASADGGSVPTGAHTPLKDLIAAHETGSTGADSYGVVFGHAERGGPLAPPKPITQMTIGEVLDYQRKMKPLAHSSAFPVGRAQWTESTLRGLTHGMDPSTVFSSEVQERLFDKSIAQRMGQGVGGFRSEWDSLNHVDAGTIQGAIAGQQKAVADAKAAMPKLAAGDGKTPGWMDDRSRRELAGVNKALAGDLLAASEQTGLHFRVMQGLRTQSEADHNAFTGRGVRNSQHLFGAAADIMLQDARGRDVRNRDAYKRFADAYTEHSRTTGGHSRWLGDLSGRWGSDIAHFDQGIGYGQSHLRDPYGSSGPTKEDIAKGNEEIYRSPQNPLMRHPAAPSRKSLLDEANKAGLGSTTIKHEGGAVVEIRGLPQGKGTKVQTHGMIEAVNLRRGGLTTQVG